MEDAKEDSESMEFDGPEEEQKVEENPYQTVGGEKDTSFSSTDSSKKSKRIIEFDEDDQIIEDRQGSTLEMVDLKVT